MNKVVAVCNLMEALLLRRGGANVQESNERLHPLVATTFVFCYVWGIGGNLVEASQDPFDSFVRDQFNENPDVKVKGGFASIKVFKY